MLLSSYVLMAVAYRWASASSRWATRSCTVRRAMRSMERVIGVEAAVLQGYQ